MRITSKILFAFFAFFLLSQVGCIRKSNEQPGGISRKVGIPLIWPVTAGFNGSPSMYNPEDTPQKK